MTITRVTWPLVAAFATVLCLAPDTGYSSDAEANRRLNSHSQSRSFMPHAEDYTFLWWADGPPSYFGMTIPAPEPILCFQSGSHGLAFDTKNIRILHAGQFSRRLQRETDFQRVTAALSTLPPLELTLLVRLEKRTFTCRRSEPWPKDPFYFPVRFVESGRFLQRVAVEGLKFEDAAGAQLPATGRLEIAFWPDRATLLFELGKLDSPAQGELIIIAGTKRVAVPLGVRSQAILKLYGPENRVMPGLEVRAPLTLLHNDELDCALVRLPAEAWRNSKGTYYPEEELDRLDRWRFKLRNDSPEEAVLPVVFEHLQPPAITGFTPLLCDPDGTPTGLPVQISKNWHRREDKGDLPHQGPWFHGCTFVRLPGRCEREFTLELCYARYGGVPAASHAQLCLIGWGHNQFWDQAAIGSFGESICYEPGRVQRRCSIDDVRPLMTLPETAARPFGWAGNCGGGDFLMWTDVHGQYQGFKGTRVDYRAYGPCLTDVEYHEQTRGGEINSRVRVSIGRSDDYLRAFHHLRYDVLRPVKWARLAFYQLGADFYNDTPDHQVAVGDALGKRDEWAPDRARDQYGKRGLPLTGKNPWISIHGLERDAVNKGGARASRGLIVRSWKAVLNGKPCPEPHASFYANEWGKGNFRTVVELSPPPDVLELRRGDYVEADVELVAFPTEPAAYYGSNVLFRSALEQCADTWRLVQREAAGNALEIKTVRGNIGCSYPICAVVDRRGEAECLVQGGLGFVPITFKGLRQYRGLELRVDGVPLSQSVHGNDFWQTDYDEIHKTWNVTYNIPRDTRGPTRVELRQASGEH